MGDWVDARLRLDEPEVLSVHEQEDGSTNAVQLWGMELALSYTPT
jgi:hypothetical protein